MSIASEIVALTTDRNDIRTALVNKGVTAAANHGFDDFASDIASIVTGGTFNVIETPDSHGGTVLEITTQDLDLSNDTVTPETLLSGYTAHDASGMQITGTLAMPYVPVLENMVNFYDYDGTLLYSYSASDFQALTEMPPNPSHTGLTAQGWNWSLADAKTEVSNSGVLDIGQLYVTDDGKTRLYITISDSTLLDLNLGVNTNSQAYVDWGDGSSPSLVNGSSIYTQQKVPHTYSATGSYVIKVYPANSSSRCAFGSSDTASGLFYFGTNYTGTGTSDWTRAAKRILNKVELGSNVRVGATAFKSCVNLASITIANDTTFNSQNTFEECYSLRFIVLPHNTDVTESMMGNFFLAYCYGLKNFSLPKTITTIGQDAFTTCRNLKSSLYLPSSVTAVNSYAFEYCTSLRFVSMNGCTEIGYRVFSECDSLQAVSASVNITSIGSYAFYGCDSLTGLTMTNSIQSIGSYAFYNCHTLGNITLPTNSNFTTISASTFCNCDSLTKITIPASVTTINTNVFANCRSLREIHFLSSTPPTVSATSAFTAINGGCKIYVPTGSLSAYTSASNYPSSSSYTYVEE